MSDDTHPPHSQPWHLPHGTIEEDEPLLIAGRSFRSRLVLGTGKYDTFELMESALNASETELVTVAVRRLNLSGGRDQTPSIFDFIDLKRFSILPNTAGCKTAEDAIRVARLAREAFQTNLIKLEVIGNDKTLLPDMEQTIQAAQELVRDDFAVLPYIIDDPVAAQKLADMGCAAIMPLAAPIGSGLGICNIHSLALIREAVTHVPVIVDAGVGVPSDAAKAMEAGCDGVLMNTGIAMATHPVRMARAMRDAIQAGRHGFLAGPMEKRQYAHASSIVGEKISMETNPTP